MIEIVKVRRPDENEDWLVVENQSKTLTSRQPLTNAIREKLKDDKVGFFKGAWSSIVGWGLSDRVPDQDW